MGDTDPAIKDLIDELVKGGTPTGEGFNTEAIARLAEIGPQAIEPLIKALQTGKPWARANAAMALGAIRDGRPEVVEALSQTWLDPNKIVSIAGRQALMRLPHPTDPELMERVHRSVNEKMREILQRIRPDIPLP